MSEEEVENAEKRAHHNALERKRRDHIKDSFNGLRDAVPALLGEKSVSRAQILKKAADYIQIMRRKHGSHQQDIADLKRQNFLLEGQIKSFEKSRALILAASVQQSQRDRFGQEFDDSLSEDDTTSTSSDGCSDTSEHKSKKRKVDVVC